MKEIYCGALYHFRLSCSRADGHFYAAERTFRITCQNGCVVLYSFLFDEMQKIQEKQNIFCPVSTSVQSPCHTRSGIVGIKLNFS
jgi:hypothetical protein